MIDQRRGAATLENKDGDEQEADRVSQREGGVNVAELRRGPSKFIAQRLTEAKRDVPHFYLMRQVDPAALLAFRGRLNELLGDRGKVSVNDLIVKAVALALRRVEIALSQVPEVELVGTARSGRDGLPEDAQAGACLLRRDDQRLRPAHRPVRPATAHG